MGLIERDLGLIRSHPLPSPFGLASPICVAPPSRLRSMLLLQFNSLRPGCLEPVALHPASRRRSYRPITAAYSQLGRRDFHPRAHHCAGCYAGTIQLRGAAVLGRSKVAAAKAGEFRQGAGGTIWWACSKRVAFPKDRGLQPFGRRCARGRAHSARIATAKSRRELVAANPTVL